ncbi:protein-tyrosine phosphatase family protein [Cellulomonas sp. Leaf334]|uniref:protein-tyrosine phosphatase family protein n=1 Tax=Cellulomonas sp. Leaf334 TaxID=1736339 RepID=UPI00070110CA|nr:protein-tyrosine phosphatase family protein [Cellulomonas sp. Leaf334]KQR16468.1 protein phosphatase [Cellulomonas sp. Leaf334]
MSVWSARVEGVVTLPDGRRVRGRGLGAGPPHGDELPEYGLYLIATPPVDLAWECHWVCWPDFRLPRSSADAIAAIEAAYERAASSKVEIACDGGTGRTGTAIAVLARLAGVPGDEAVRWVRANYRPRAVETPWQRRFAARVPLSR